MSWGRDENAAAVDFMLLYVLPGLAALWLIYFLIELGLVTLVGVQWRRIRGAYRRWRGWEWR